MAQPGGDPAARRRRGPDEAEIAELLRAGASAPSSHNSQPWRLRWHEDAVEVHGDPARHLHAADPDARELRIACGAAIANVRLTARAQGRRAHTQLLPDRDDPWFYGRVRPGAPWPPAGWEVELARAVRRRHTDRHPFADRPLSAGLRDQLLRAAWRESCRLVIVDDRALRRGLLALTAEAHHQQQSDPSFVAEWDRWIGSGSRSGDGLPAELARRAPRPDAAWRPRDFGGSTAEGDRVVSAEDPTEHEPTIAVVTSFDDGALAQLRAGLALEQVLLTATARGVGASFVAPPLEVAAVRVRVRALLGGVLWPQVILRLGWGRPVHPTPRRPAAG
ncbi:nitroreductase family protein [Actinomycetospora lutea]|uniref:Acg family FMN-binding oxidoreductase n=1 Tax=Actinomycetospora lutea TaxID=663604 RepID=UPI0023660751|nr:nitroreductase family protein [Actinomycetospora lutea]MDD7939528.1 nitroreductase family protein [Actinomycetospora lutea]